MDELKLAKLLQLKQLHQLKADRDAQAHAAANARYIGDPTAWIGDRLGEFCWSKQRDIAESVRDNRRTAVKSCHDAGKSWISSRIATWWIDTHPPGEALVVSTAPTYQQVHAILWEEIRKAAGKAANRGNPLPGRLLQSDVWKFDDGTLAGFGRKPADTDIHGFQGHHRRYVLVILDEACGIPQQLWTAVEAITTNADCRILAIGNPDDPAAEFGSVCKPGSGWNVIKISAFDTPNFTDEPVPGALRPLLLDPEWELDKRTRWGAESPRYISKVLGDFPDIGDDVLISPSLIEAARQRALEPSGAGILGVDVARFGMDRTVIYLRRGPVIRKVGEWSKQATTETTGRVIATKHETGADEIRVDGVGVGGGVVDQLTEQGFGALDMQAGAGASDRERFANARAEWAWSMRERLEAGDLDLDPADDDLAAQLGAFKYRYNSRGQIVIESKDEMRKRGLPSPDHADAAILTAITPAGADLFRRVCWRHWTLDGAHIVTAGRTWSLADSWVFLTAFLPSGEGGIGDFAVVSAWARTIDGSLILLDRARWRNDQADMASKVTPLVRRWRPDTMFMPKKQRSVPLVADLNGLGVHSMPVDAEADAMSRAFPASTQQAAGKIWLPTATWTESFKSECLAFPNSRHAGSVETLGLAVRVIATHYAPGPAAPSPIREQTFESFGTSEIDFSQVEM